MSSQFEVPEGIKYVQTDDKPMSLETSKTHELLNMNEPESEQERKKNLN